jgi:hypothetical protein
MKIFKAKTGVFWDRLLSESGKHHWLSVDWSKWKDEDESDDDVQFGGHAQNFNDFNVCSLFTALCPFLSLSVSPSLSSPFSFSLSLSYFSYSFLVWW